VKPHVAMTKGPFATHRQVTGTPYIHRAYVYVGNRVVLACPHQHGAGSRRGRGGQLAQACADRMLRRYLADCATTGKSRSAHDLPEGVLVDPPPADLTFDVYLVGHGIESHVYVDGKLASSYIRDFSGDHAVEALKNKFYQAVVAAIKKTRDSL
jgi:hypothetical protein